MSNVFNTKLVQDVYQERQDIKEFVDLFKIGNVQAEIMIVATFGKIWNVTTQDFQTAGECRDTQKELLEHASGIEEKTLLGALGFLVGTMFDKKPEIITQA